MSSKVTSLTLRLGFKAPQALCCAPRPFDFPTASFLEETLAGPCCKNNSEALPRHVRSAWLTGSQQELAPTAGCNDDGGGGGLLPLGEMKGPELLKARFSPGSGFLVPSATANAAENDGSLRFSFTHCSTCTSEELDRKADHGL